MHNHDFIKEVLEKGEGASEKAVREFSDLSEIQINWKPSPKSWSIAECLEHLIISNRIYFEVLDKIAEGSYKMNWKERFSPLTGFWGWAMKDQLQEKVRKKMVTHKILTPASSLFKSDQLGIYVASIRDFLSRVSRCQNVDLESPQFALADAPLPSSQMP